MFLSVFALRSPFVPAAVVVALASGLPGCSSDDDDGASPPDGVTCASVSRADNAQTLVNAAANTAAGGCVVVSGALTSTSPVIVAEGVTLVGAKGTRPSIAVTEAVGTSAIYLGARAQLGNLDVVAAPKVGVSLTGTDVRIFDVKVTGAKNAGIAIMPVNDAVTATLEDVVAEKNGYGVYANGDGVTLTMKGGRISENGGTSLSAGAGLVAVAGAHVTLDGVTIEKNEGTGVLLDGAKTRAVVRTSTVAENRERGIWAQGLQGTLDEPALAVHDTQVSKNRIVGVGGVELKGIIIVGGSVKETVASPVPTNLATNELVGDGVGIFGGSTDFKIERTNFASNERAAGVVDGSEVGIIIVGGKVEPGPGLKFVVQNSKADVQIADSDKSVLDKPLPISAPKIQTPNVF